MVVGELMRGLLDRDEFHRNHFRALVQHLEIGVLAIGARLAPQNRRGVVRQGVALHVYRLAIALHFKLLQISGQTPQGAVIRRDGTARETQKIAVPDVQQAKPNRQVLRQFRGSEVFVHGMRTGEEFAEAFCANGNRQGQADGGPQ